MRGDRRGDVDAWWPDRSRGFLAFSCHGCITRRVIAIVISPIGRGDIGFNRRCSTPSQGKPPCSCLMGSVRVRFDALEAPCLVQSYMVGAIVLSTAAVAGAVQWSGIRYLEMALGHWLGIYMAGIALGNVITCDIRSDVPQNRY